jgi:phospholipid-binding lipoprotein MlaA
MKMIDRILIFILLVLCLCTFSGPCLAESVRPSLSSEPSISVSTSDEAVGTIADPLEPVNRAFFHFNDKLYFWVLKPVATGYKAVIPEDGRIGVHNFFSNVTTPVRLVNCLLQAKFKGAGNETARFALNTTLGIAGFFDPAKKTFKIDKQEADFGQTLGIWGIGTAFYIDWPILGPSNVRDTVGYVGDLAFDPRTYVAYYFVIAEIVNTGTWALDKVNDTSLTLGEYENFKKAALDPYVALREAYSQYRQNKIIASKLKNGSANSNKINNSEQSTELKESRKAKVIAETPPLEPEMKKTEQIPSHVGEKLGSSVRDKKIVTVTWTFVIIRWGSRNDYPIVTTVNQGDKLIVIGESGEWFYVRLEGGQQGWVSDRVVK